MSFPIYCRYPNGQVEEIPVEADTKIGEVLELICDQNRLLPRGHIGLFHKGVKLLNTNEVREYNLKPTVMVSKDDKPVAKIVLTVVVLFGDTLITREDCTYESYIHVSFPSHGEKEIPINIQPLIKFKKNKSNYVIYLPSLSDISALETSGDGNMREYLGEEISSSLGFLKWSEKSYPFRMFLLELDNESVVSNIKSLMYSSFTTNPGYTNGDRHSWQRYSNLPPIDCYVHINEHENSVRLLPTEPLKPATVYGIVLLNGVPTVPADYASMQKPLFSYWRPGICEDTIIVFRTKKPRVFQAPSSLERESSPTEHVAATLTAGEQALEKIQQRRSNETFDALKSEENEK